MIVRLVANHRRSVGKTIGGYSSGSWSSLGGGQAKNAGPQTETKRFVVFRFSRGRAFSIAIFFRSPPPFFLSASYLNGSKLKIMIFYGKTFFSSSKMNSNVIFSYKK
jgi:hypothetical protein